MKEAWTLEVILADSLKWAVTAALHYEEIKSHPEGILNLRKYVDNYDWSGLEFPLSIKGISKFEKNNDVPFTYQA